MKQIEIGTSGLLAPRIVVGCMRLAQKNKQEMNRYLHTALENGITFFDHADIYADGESEKRFGEAFFMDHSLKREDVLIQSKCGIKKGYYDLSKQYILDSVDGILKRLRTDYLDILLLHRPDALVEPREVAEAFDILEKSGKVRYFGVSNHKPMQIELLNRYLTQKLHVNQLQFSIPASNMVANGIEVNMDTPGSVDHDGSVLDYCRLHDITIQAWSPFQMPNWQGCFLNKDRYAQLSAVARRYKVSEAAAAAAWILRHPAKMQVIVGTSDENHLKSILEADRIELDREEWYRIYQDAGHLLP